MNPASARHAAGPAAIVLANVLLLTGCAHHARPVTGVTTASATGGGVATSVPTTWVALLAPPPQASADDVQGRANITVNPTAQTASVLMFLTGLQHGQSYLWHIRRGPCSPTEPKGPPDEYAPLTVDAHGRGSAAGWFPLLTPALGDYHLDVHEAGDGGQLVAGPDLACGQIIAPSP